MYNGPQTRAVPPLPGGAPSPMYPSPQSPNAPMAQGAPVNDSAPMPSPPQPGDNAMNMNKPTSPFQSMNGEPPLWLKGFLSSPYAKLMQAKTGTPPTPSAFPPPQAPGQMLQQSASTMNPAPAWAAPATMAR